MTAKPMLSVENLSVEFKTRNGIVPAVCDVSFAVQKGETVGIVGESGSGKSVSAYTVIGLLDDAGRVSSGTTNFDGVNLTESTESELCDIRGREISMIFQNPRAALNPIRPVGRQIEDVLRRHAQATRQNARTRAIEMLKKVKIVDPEHRYWSYPFELSGGMCQRVMIAIALACNPRLLIADEPTTGLDVTTQKATMDLIKDLTQERHMSVVLITHDLGMAATYCDRIVVMKKGKIVEAATVNDLFSNPQHPYTQKLIAASPGPNSCLEDLNAIPDEMVDVENVVRMPASPKPKTFPNDKLLEVIDLVKVFPKSSGQIKHRWPWAKTDPTEHEFRAVDGISFKMRRGESIGLVGESGCGKSTTSSMLTRLLDPTSGSIVFDGEDIGAIPAEKFARMAQRTKIQMVFQDATDSLNPRFSVIDAISDPLKRLKGMRNGKDIEDKVRELAARVGLPEHLLRRFPHQLSGGQKARVGIARAIAVEPQLLILDEPTSALDVSVQAVVLQLLDQLRRDTNMSYLFVSHDLNVVRLLCDRVIVMNRGQIVEEGMADDVLRNPQAAYTKTLIEAIPKVHAGLRD